MANKPNTAQQTVHCVSSEQQNQTVMNLTSVKFSFIKYVVQSAVTESWQKMDLQLGSWARGWQLFITRNCILCKATFISWTWDTFLEWPMHWIFCLLICYLKIWRLKYTENLILPVLYGMKSILHIKGNNRMRVSWKQGAEGNIWTEEGGSNRMLQKTV